MSPRAANSDERSLHLGTGREVELAVHEERRERLMALDVSEEAVVVVPLVLAGSSRDRSIGLRPADQALVHGEATEHAAGLLVSRDDCAAADAGTGQAVCDLEATGATADDDDVVGAGRERTLVYPAHVLAARSRLASI